LERGWPSLTHALNSRDIIGSEVVASATVAAKSAAVRRQILLNVIVGVFQFELPANGTKHWFMGEWPMSALGQKRNRGVALQPQSSGVRMIPADYIRDLRSTKWGSEASLHGINPEPPMSALCQKQTFAKSFKVGLRP